MESIRPFIDYMLLPEVFKRPPPTKNKTQGQRHLRASRYDYNSPSATSNSDANAEPPYLWMFRELEDAKDTKNADDDKSSAALGQFTVSFCLLDDEHDKVGHDR